MCRNDKYCLERNGQNSCRLCRFKACLFAGMRCKTKSIDKSFILNDKRFKDGKELYSKLIMIIIIKFYSK